MRLRVAGNDGEQVITLTLTQNENEVSVDIKGKDEWQLITFRIENDKLVFARNGGIDDDIISTDVDGNIVEVDE